MLRFATAVNYKSRITNQKIVTIRRIIFIFLQKYLSYDRRSWLHLDKQMQKVVWQGIKLLFSELPNKVAKVDKMPVDMIKSA
jgi:hypothetical protein